MTTTSIPGTLRTVSEAAKRLSVSRSHIYHLMDIGELAYVKLGKARRIPDAAILEMIDRNMVAAR